MARKKQTALNVPTSAEAARTMLEEYVSAERSMLEVRVNYERSIDDLKAERDRLLEELAAPQKDRFAGLKAWWEAGGKDLAGKGRSAELANATIGQRMTPPAVKLKRGIKPDAIVAWLRSIRWSESSRFFRVKTELDKQAIIKAIAADEPTVREVFEGQGLTVVQVDEFFIDTGLDEDAIRKEQAAA